MKTVYFKEANGEILLNLKVIPNASKDEVVGLLNYEYLKIKVTKAPEAGKANKAIEVLLARFFDLKKKSVSIVSGHTSSLKVVKLSGLSKDALQNKIDSI